MPWPFLAALAAIGEAAGTGAAAVGSTAGSTLGGLSAGMSAGLAGGAAGAATGAGSTLAGVGAGAAMGAGAGLGSGLMSAAGSAGSALTPALNSAANGTMQMAPIGSKGPSGLFGSSMPATYQAAMGNSTAGAVPMSTMKPLGSSMPQSLSDVKPLASSRFDYQDIASRMGQGMQGGGGDQHGSAAMPAPGLMRGLMTPFTPMAFSPSNYQFRRGPGY